MGTWLTRPETTVRGLSSPQSIFSTYKVSASGCLLISTIFPILKSNLPTVTTPSFACGLGLVLTELSFSFFSFLAAGASFSLSTGAFSVSRSAAVLLGMGYCFLPFNVSSLISSDLAFSTFAMRIPFS